MLIPNLDFRGHAVSRGSGSAAPACSRDRSGSRSVGRSPPVAELLKRGQPVLFSSAPAAFTNATMASRSSNRRQQPNELVAGRGQDRGRIRAANRRAAGSSSRDPSNSSQSPASHKRLCHIEIARWQIGGDVVSHGSAQLVGHAGRMSDCGAVIGGGMAHHDHAGLGERRTKRALTRRSAQCRHHRDCRATWPCCP